MWVGGIQLDFPTDLRRDADGQVEAIILVEESFAYFIRDRRFARRNLIEDSAARRGFWSRSLGWGGFSQRAGVRGQGGFFRGLNGLFRRLGWLGRLLCRLGGLGPAGRRRGGGGRGQAPGLERLRRKQPGAVCPR